MPFLSKKERDLIKKKTDDFYTNFKTNLFDKYIKVGASLHGGVDLYDLENLNNNKLTKLKMEVRTKFFGYLKTWANESNLEKALWTSLHLDANYKPTEFSDDNVELVKRAAFSMDDADVSKKFKDLFNTYFKDLDKLSEWALAIQYNKQPAPAEKILQKLVSTRISILDNNFNIDNLLVLKRKTQELAMHMGFSSKIAEDFFKQFLAMGWTSVDDAMKDQSNFDYRQREIKKVFSLSGRDEGLTKLLAISDNGLLNKKSLFETYFEVLSFPSPIPHTIDDVVAGVLE